MKQTRRFVIILIMFLIVTGAVSLRSAENKKDLVYAESLGLAVAEVDGEELVLADLAFYIAYEEREIEKKAYIYNPKNTGEYWRLFSHFLFLRKEGKDAVMDMAIHDTIFYDLAVKEGIALDEEELQRLSNAQYDFWSDLEEEQREALGVGEDVIKESMRRLAVAEKYQYVRAAEEGKSFDSYSIGGSAYGELLAEHEYEVNEDVWGRISFGGITVKH